MLVSILHRVTGSGLAVVGGGLLVWWLLALAGGADGYATFVKWAAWPWALVVWVPLTWALFQHTFSGLRHFVMDIGAGYELYSTREFAVDLLKMDIEGGERILFSDPDTKDWLTHASDARTLLAPATRSFAPLRMT